MIDSELWSLIVTMKQMAHKRLIESKSCNVMVNIEGYYND